MRSFLFILAIIFPTASILGQTLALNYGIVYPYTQQSIELINSPNPLLNSGGFVSIDYKKSFNANQNIEYNIGANFYPGDTYFSDGNGSFHGYQGSRIFRLDLGVGYNFLNPKNNFYITPSVGFSLMFTKKTSEYGSFFPLNGPYYFQTEAPYSETKYSSFQLVPSAALSIGVKIRKLIDLSFKIRAVYGYQTFQTIYLKYEYYLDNPRIERQAIFETNGTAMFRSVCIGIDLDALKRKKEEKEKSLTL